MSSSDAARDRQSVAELVLEATMTQPLTSFCSADAIDPDLEVDDRSAIDQFMATIESLNVVLVRHSRTEVRGADQVLPPAEAGEVDLESLFAIEVVDDSEAAHAPSDKGRDQGQDAVSRIATDDSEKPLPLEVPEDEVTLQLNNLVFLGYMSAVESYFRCLTRQLIWADDFTADAMQDVKISFGAARHADPRLLPEVLMEDMTFITLDSVKDLLVRMIGVGVEGVSDLLKEYDRICQLRHCIVHRFGRLGSKNAFKLGLQVHRTLIERKIKIRTSQLEALAFNLLNFVKAINNHIYAGVLKRSAAKSMEWQWDPALDMDGFDGLYKVFRQTSSPGASADSNHAYAVFKAQCEKGSATQIERAKLARRSK